MNGNLTHFELLGKKLEQPIENALSVLCSQLSYKNLEAQDDTMALDT